MERMFPSLEPVVSKLEKFELFQTVSHLYVIAYDKTCFQCRILKFDRRLSGPTVTLADICQEDPIVYSYEEMNSMLEMVHEGNKTRGGLSKVAEGFGIVGFVKFLDCYYLNLITERMKVGLIGGNLVYTIKATELFPIKIDEDHPYHHYNSHYQQQQPCDSPHQMSGWGQEGKYVTPHQIHEHEGGATGRGEKLREGMWSQMNRKLNPAGMEISEARYLSLFQLVDTTKDFFFSYTYDVTNSLQLNMMAATSKTFPPPPFKDMYAWNFFQTRELEALVGHLNSSFWVLPIIHGAFLQRKCSIFGRLLTMTLVGRRSRHFAGTRYLKRGVSDEGYVANDVEVEQIVHAEGEREGVFSAFLQMRGSIPIFWTQESGVTIPKPPIVLSRVDTTYFATQLHFADLLTRYSTPITVLDLVKQTEKREREVIVGRDFRRAIEHINENIPDKHKIQYCSLDFSHLSKHRQINMLQSLDQIAHWTISQTKFFCSPRRLNSSMSSNDEAGKSAFNTAFMEQRGVLRTNCIDCLDRTNVAQFSIGVRALGKQFHAMGITSSDELGSDSTVILILMELYSVLGDKISLQYGGSEAHKKVSSRSAIVGSNLLNSVSPLQHPNKHKELLTSIRRYYSNAFTDRVKQDAINLFLGYFVPSEHQLPLWELESDFYLHNHLVQRSPLQSMQELKKWYYYPDVEVDDDNDDFGQMEEELGLEAALGMSLGQVNSPPGPPSEREATNISTIILDDAEPQVVRSELASVGEKIPSALEELAAKRARARQLYKQQSAASGRWWKEALRLYAQQRMWMHLGPPRQGQLPSRFCRVHEPQKLTQFDKYFSLDFAVPTSAVRNVNLSSAARLRSGSMPSLPHSPERVKVKAQERRVSEYNTYSVHSPSELIARSTSCPKRGHLLRASRSMAPLVKEAQSPCDSSPCGSWSSLPHSPRLRGSGKSPDLDRWKTWKPAPYNSLERKWHMAEKGYQTPSQESEAKAYLNHYALETDPFTAAQQCCKLTKEGHCTAVLCKGMYKGLHQSESATQVACVVFGELLSEGQLNDEDGNCDSGINLNIPCDKLLNADGLQRQIYEGMQEILATQEVFADALDIAQMGAMPSSLTNEQDIALYNSYFFHENGKQQGRLENEKAVPIWGREGVMEGRNLEFTPLEPDLFACTTSQHLRFNTAGYKAVELLGT